MKMILLFFITLNAWAFDHEHKVWNQLLKDHTKRVNGQVLFNYKKLKADAKSLKEYTNSLESLKKAEFKKFTKDQQLAFWINVYNAYTVQWIIKHYPIKSIKDTGSLFSNPWKKEFIPLFGKKMSLDEVEHGTIRKQFKEPRIHFAVNCASIGCPSLLEEAFVATTLDKQLDKAAKLFLMNKQKNYLKGKTYYLSKIFDWYNEDFGDSDEGVIKFVSPYMSPQIKTKVIQGADVEHLDYDWSLNEFK